jgi:hypothetical protein
MKMKRDENGKPIVNIRRIHGAQFEPYSISRWGQWALEANRILASQASDNHLRKFGNHR